MGGGFVKSCVVHVGIFNGFCNEKDDITECEGHEIIDFL